MNSCEKPDLSLKRSLCWREGRCWWIAPLPGSALHQGWFGLPGRAQRSISNKPGSGIHRSRFNLPGRVRKIFPPCGRQNGTWPRCFYEGGGSGLCYIGPSDSPLAKPPHLRLTQVQAGRKSFKLKRFSLRPLRLCVSYIMLAQNSADWDGFAPITPCRFPAGSAQNTGGTPP